MSHFELKFLFTMRYILNQIRYKAPEFQSMFLQGVRFRGKKFKRLGFRKIFPFKKSNFDSFYSFKSATFCIFVVFQKRALFWIKNISRCQFLNWNFFTVSDFELKIFPKLRSLIQNFFEVSDFETHDFEAKCLQRFSFLRNNLTCQISKLLISNVSIFERNLLNVSEIALKNFSKRSF